MKKTTCSLAALLAVVLAAASCSKSKPAGSPVGEPARRASAEDLKAVVTGNTAFALDLYARLKSKPGNLFFSPYSITTALAMTYAGARGNTEAQMARVLHFEMAQERLHNVLHTVIWQAHADASRHGIRLHTANALWGQQGDAFLDPFLNVVQTHYGGAVRQVDFRGAAEAARQTINRWVEAQTDGKIEALIPQGLVDNATRLVLTNAIYFRSKWAKQFRPAHTHDERFTLHDGTQVTVPMMHQTEDFGYMETAELQGLEMPYVGGEFSMVIFLPPKHDGLPALEKSLTAVNLAKWLEELRGSRKMGVHLPRFTMTAAFRLDKTLAALGMTDAFSPTAADLSGITGRKSGLYIAAVLHKAFVVVNEEGTEAAAATGVAMKSEMMRSAFVADHPFLFLIRHNPTGTILFLGRVMDPRK